MPRKLSLPARVWLILVALTALSVALAEQLGLRALAITGIFLIAAAKAELVMRYYMELGSAERYWAIMYSIWLTVVTMMLIVGHLL